MQSTSQKSFFIILTLIFLLPLFFIPGGALTLPVAKSALLALGLALSALVFFWEIWRKNEVTIPWHPFLLVLIILPIVYFISAMMSSPTNLSLFGYSLELGTTGFMIIAALLLMFVTVSLNDGMKVLKALTVFFVSFSLLALLALIRIIFDGAPTLGFFSDISDSPIGRWTDLATAAGLLSVFSILMLGLVPMQKPLKILSYGAYLVSLFLLVVLNFYSTFVITLIVSVILFFYFKKFESASSQPDAPKPGIFSKPSIYLVVLAIVSVIFIIDPTISEDKGTLGNVISTYFGVTNTEVRPSFSTTLTVSKGALSNDALLGTGPNTFLRDWLVHKPAGVNETPFWAVAFPFGIGFIPTQVASTGIVGTFVWLVFFITLLALGIKSLYRLPESRTMRFSLVSSYIALLYLWIATFMYSPSSTLVILAFIFTGIFLAVASQTGVIGGRQFILSKDNITKSLSAVLIVLVLVGVGYMAYISTNKTISAYYFKKAIDMSNVEGTSLDDVEALLNRATEYSPVDVHYTSISRLNFARAQTIANTTTGNPQENLELFQDAISKSVASARTATELNPTGFENWIALGAVYTYLVPPPLSVEGAYDNAKIAFEEAGERNPASPEVPLYLARLEINNGDADAARTYIRQAVSLKADYADAHLMLTQLELQQNNIRDAIVSAEQLAIYSPGNAAIYFELGLLKYSAADYQGALEALAAAIQVVPDYANAIYYAGLSLLQLDDLEQALGAFKTLLVTNPDNEEIQGFVTEIEAGRNPLKPTPTRR